MASRLSEYYKKSVSQALVERFKYKNLMQVPAITKIIVNMGLGEAIQNPKVIDSARDELASITGQLPLLRKARKSIASFKLREGMTIGCKVTLRRDNMYHFLDKLISVALPRVRDFRGVSPKGFDGRGNYSMGLDEQSVFPEIDAARIEHQQGMNITFVTSAQTDDESRELLKLFGMPFKA